MASRTLFRPHRLTPRQREVVNLLAGGARYDEIASTLGVSLDCVTFHISEARKRMNAKTNPQLTLLCHLAGELDIADPDFSEVAAFRPVKIRSAG